LKKWRAEKVKKGDRVVLKVSRAKYSFYMDADDIEDLLKWFGLLGEPEVDFFFSFFSFEHFLF